MRGKFGAVLIVCLAAAACAGTPGPDSQMAVAATHIADAERDGAAQYAPDELTAARAKLDQARDAVRDGDNKLAERLAGEAAADAQLADLKAKVGAQQASSGASRRSPTQNR